MASEAEVILNTAFGESKLAKITAVEERRVVATAENGKEFDVDIISDGSVPFVGMKGMLVCGEQKTFFPLKERK